MKTTTRTLLDGACYVVVFLIIQLAVSLMAMAVWPDLSTNAVALVVCSVVSSAVTIALFAWRRWSPFSRRYLQTRPWTALFWVALLAVGTIVPSEWLLERLGLEMPEAETRLFAQLMSTPWGYLAIALLVPLAEEMVFRGALLRVLLRVAPARWHWLPIAVSALVFGAVHGNWPQFLHAMLVGLLIGWMYWRTGSIVPGLVLHWVNNTVAYVVSRLMPGLQDANLIDLCGGDVQKELLYVGFSLCVLLPSLYQLSFRLRREG